jgi:ribonuclease P protein component
VTLRYTLKKHQILSSKKEISHLFNSGKSISEYPIKLVYLIVPKIESSIRQEKFKVMFVVPKKQIRKSAHRNTIKRKMRESFRLLQHDLKSIDQHTYFLTFIYISKDRNQDTLMKIPESIKKLIEKINTSS